MNKLLILVLCIAVVALAVVWMMSTGEVSAVNWNSAAPHHLAVNWNS